MDMSVNVIFPDEVLVVAREDREQFARQSLLYTLGHLYAQGKASSGFAARILGCDRWEFYRLLTENGFAVIDYPAEEQALESQSSRELAERIRQR
jgi:predicted HTH domain antitoxin